jgi:hypothetical protein
MRLKWLLTAFVLTGLIAMSCAAAEAQAGATGAQAQTTRQPAQATESYGETAVAVSGLYALNKSTTGNGTVETPTNAAGGMLELLHVHSPFIGYEITYSFNAANASFAPTSTGCGYDCQLPPQTITSHGSVLGLDWLISKKYGAFRPFLVGGIGFFIDYPTTFPRGTLYSNNDVVRPDYIYGGGVDWGFGSHLGVRLQYRGNIYKAPNISHFYPATGQFTQTAMPMAGVYYRF